MSSDDDRHALAEAQAQLLLKALARGLEISWVAHGTSMHPSIPSGSSVTITPLNPERLKRGEVGLFIQSDELQDTHQTRVDDPQHAQTDDPQNLNLTHRTEWILHRVLRNDPKRRLIYTRGDHLPRSDIPFTYLQCVGVLKCIDPPAAKRQHAWPKLCSLSVWVNRRDARSVTARMTGLFWATLYPLYHRLKYRRLKVRR